jgi:signal transduction histidine kinase
VIGDPGNLTQLVMNLLGNAARYTDQGGARVELISGDGRAYLVVSDTGIGIPPEHLQRIFERFYRVDKGRSRAAGGTGLGLAIARWVVDAHGGTISAESAVGRGSVFRVTLPLAPTDEHTGPMFVAGTHPNSAEYGSAPHQERAPAP